MKLFATQQGPGKPRLKFLACYDCFAGKGSTYFCSFQQTCYLNSIIIDFICSIVKFFVDIYQYLFAPKLKSGNT